MTPRHRLRRSATRQQYQQQRLRIALCARNAALARHQRKPQLTQYQHIISNNKQTRLAASVKNKQCGGVKAKSANGGNQLVIVALAALAACGWRGYRQET